MTNQKKWYESWFDTPYYHILYNHRDDQEAEFFIKNLVSFLKIEKNQSILDLACGKGRHSLFLNALGFDVTGVDLSEQNILFAKKFEKPKLHFFVKDMRQPLNESYDVIFNLFTSFGYFDSLDDDLKVLQNMKASLSTNGIGVIDFLNVDYALKHLISEESIQKDHLTFQINRHYDGTSILKSIAVMDKKEAYNFSEKVSAYRLKDFESMFEAVGLRLLNCFGDYNLNSFNPSSSERLILVFTKL